jgi:hypothetical protein
MVQQNSLFNKPGADVWAEILKEAIDRAVKVRGRATPGATLRQIVARVASERGLEYPPAETPKLKFATFLELHPGIVAVRKEREADILVAPADTPELLVDVKTANRPLPGVRQDMFEGFTRIRSDKLPWYDKEKDHVEWHPREAKLDSPRYVSIPSPSIEDLRNGRKRFAAAQSEEKVRAALEQAADSPAGLAAFTAVVRDAGLRAEWHQFRIRNLVDHIGTWATREGVQWQDAWLTAGAPAEGTFPAQLVGYEPRDWHRMVASVIQSLDAQDAARIMVPLDIVIKILGRR